MAFSEQDGQSSISGDFSMLEELIAKLQESHSIDIGVFATAIAPNGESVAEYGAVNEFGSITNKIPKRSFILMPLTTHQKTIQEYVEKHEQEHLEQRDIKAIFEDIGIAGESVIEQAFDTRGFGTWAPDAPATILHKGSDAPLIDTGLLRRSITHRVK